MAVISLATYRAKRDREQKLAEAKAFDATVHDIMAPILDSIATWSAERGLTFCYAYRPTFAGADGTADVLAKEVACVIAPIAPNSGPEYKAPDQPTPGIAVLFKENDVAITRASIGGGRSPADPGIKLLKPALWMESRFNLGWQTRFRENLSVAFVDHLVRPLLAGREAHAPGDLPPSSP